MDITFQKTSEQIIQQSEERFRNLTETLPQLIWETDGKGAQKYASVRWKEYTGLEHISDETWEKIIHPEDMPIVTSAWMDSLATGHLYKTEARLKNHKDEYRWHFIQGVPIRNENDEIHKWIGSCTDIHYQKTITENLENLVSERTKELQRSNEDLQEFAHVASHDLKEPVRKVRTFASRLYAEYGDQLPETAKTYVVKMEAAVKRMYSMIDGVLLYSTLNGTGETQEIIDLNKIVHNIENDLELVIQQKNAIIQYKDLHPINGFPILIYQLFYNLINNSLKFSKPGSSLISVTSSLSANGVEITVSDNGIGFDQAYSEKIFKTFSRLNSKDKYEGTGLGLALCKKIVERHKGTIRAQGKEDSGASFVISLPTTQEH